MKKVPLILSLILIISLLAGCAGTPVVYYTNCTCPAADNNAVAAPPDAPEKPELSEGALKTGLCITTSVKDSKAGEAKYDVTMVAVLVGDDGIIHDCIIDGISTSIKFDEAGALTTDLSVAPQTKNELGTAYNMVAWGGAIAEWDVQAAALADFAVGKTVEELRSGAVSESGYAPEGNDLASSATIYLAGYVDAIEIAAKNAQHLGAVSGDTLKMATIANIAGSAAATAEKNGNAQLDADVTALTVNGETITSCVIDSVQAKVAFDGTGAVTSDLTAPIQTKNELGASYNMVAWGGAIAEWNEQAASFAAYVTGKTAGEVGAIQVTEADTAADADLATSVTIKINTFMDLIVKAAK